MNALRWAIVPDMYLRLNRYLGGRGMKLFRTFSFGLLVALLAPCAGQAQTLSTVAGGAYGEGRAATEAALYSPRRLALGPGGEIYIADAAAERVYLVDASRSLRLVAGNGIRTGVIDGPGGDPRDDLGDGGPAADCTFNTISGLAVDASGRLYISDTFNHRVRRVDPDGVIRTVLGTGAAAYNGEGVPAASAELNRPRGIYLRNDRLYVADSANHRIRVATEDGRLYTFAGVGTPGAAGNGGPARDAQLNFPSDLCFDTAGNAYVADTNNNLIRRVNTSGVISLFMGGGNQDESPSPTLVRLLGPTAVDIDAVDDSLYVADTGQQRIRLWREGSVRIVAGNGIPGYAGDGFLAIAALVNFPQDVLVLPDRSCLVADTDNGRIRRISPAPLSEIQTFAGEGDTGVGAGDGEGALEAILAQPAGIAGRPGGGFYLADTGHHRVRVVLPDGSIRPFAGTGQPGLAGEVSPATEALLAGPRGLAVDGQGRLLIADTLNHRVRLVGPSGNIRTYAGSTRGSGGENVPATQAQLDTPLGLALDATGNLYIADSANHKIRVVSPGGTISTFAGSGTAGNLGVGGDRLNLRMVNPAGVAVGPDGQVYIADTGNQRVLRIDLSGTVRLAAGLAAGADYVLDLAGPTGVALDAAGNLYIADAGGHLIFMGDRIPFQRGLLLAGTGLPGFNGELFAAPREAALAAPYALALDAEGALLIADRDNHRARRLAIHYPPGDVNGDYVVDYRDLFALSMLLDQGTVVAEPFSELYRANLAPDALIDLADVAAFWSLFRTRP